MDIKSSFCFIVSTFFLLCSAICAYLKITGEPYMIECLLFLGLSLTFSILGFIITAFNKFLATMETFLETMIKTLEANKHPLPNDKISGSFIIGQKDDGSMFTNASQEDMEKLQGLPFLEEFFGHLKKENKTIETMTGEELQKKLSKAIEEEDFLTAKKINEELEKRKDLPF